MVNGVPDIAPLSFRLRANETPRLPPPSSRNLITLAFSAGSIVMAALEAAIQNRRHFSLLTRWPGQARP
jgi:hypothetical protein